MPVTACSSHRSLRTAMYLVACNHWDLRQSSDSSGQTLVHVHDSISLRFDASSLEEPERARGESEKVGQRVLVFADPVYRLQHRQRGDSPLREQLACGSTTTRPL